VAQYADRVLYFPTTDDRRPTTDEGIADSDHSFCTRTNLRPSSFVLGSAREVFARIDLAPPLVRIGKALGWSPLPLTIKEGRQLVRARLDIEDWRTPPDTNQAPSSKLQAPSVTVEHAHFAYDEHEAIYDVSIAAYPGEVLALMGRNGSGKTTLLKLLAGLLKPERGTIRILDRNIIPLPVENIAAFVGYVPQDPRTLLFHDTLKEELAFTLEGRKPGVRGQGSGARGRGSGVGGQGSGVRDYTTKGEGQMTNHGQRTTDNGQISISNTLERFDLAHLANAYPRDLSGGEAQRTALATILVGDPPVLLLDEPTRGLDYDAKGALGQLLRRLASEGKTIIIVTHDVELVAAYADRVALLGDGEIIVDGPTRDVLSDSLTLSPQIAKLFPGTGLLTVEDALRSIAKPDA
jgi:energy-coupling factor transport system ATP-binding protein